MNQSITRKILFILLLIVHVCIFSCDTDEGPEIIFIHTNDTHSQIDGIYMDEQPTGGVVERAAFIELQRQKDPQLIYVDAGDMVQGSPYFNIWNGMIEMKAMNLQGLACSTFGNHEFDNGLDFLANMMEYACFPIINCNYDVQGTVLEQYTRPSMIIERKGVRIGITGVTVDPHNLIFSRNWEGIKYIDPSVAANEEAKKLRKEGCDLVVLISHVGYYNSDSIGDRYIARHSKDIDLIIGGHTHTNIENGVEVPNADGKPVMITQTGAKAAPIGQVKIKFQRDGRRSDGEPAYRVSSITCKKLHPDMYDLRPFGRAMSDFIEPYRDSLETKMSSVLGRAAHDLPRFRPQSPLSNLVSDILREVGEQYTCEKIDVGIMNVGGLRNDLYAGDIHLGDLYRIFPFENTLAILEIKGKYLEEVIHQIEGKRLEGLSGMQVTLRVKQQKEPDGATREVVHATDIKIGGQPIDPERLYRVATIDYLAEGNDGLLSLTKAQTYTNSGVLLRNLMVDYIQRQYKAGRSIDAAIDDRVIVIDEK